MTFFDAHLAFRRASREKKEPRRPCFERQGLPEQHAPPMMKPKSHHTIPRMHLQHFAGPERAGQVWTYDAVAGRQWSAIPDETCVQTHFYSAVAEDGTIDARVEEFLAQVEGRAAPVYEGLLAGRFPGNPQARFDFAQFLALMHTRTTAMRRMAGEIRGKGAQITSFAYASNPKAFEVAIRGLEAERGEKIDPALKEEVRQAMLDPSNYTLEISKESTFMALAASEKLTPILDRMTWSLAEAQSGYFITSDNPVVREVDPKTRHPIYGDNGFLNETAEISFPLSPKVLLLLSWNPSAREIGALERDHVHKLNVVRAAHSERYLFAHIKDKRITDLAEKYKDSRPGLAVEGFGPKRFAPIKVARR
jgi:hypothetical protein